MTRHWARGCARWRAEPSVDRGSDASDRVDLRLLEQKNEVTRGRWGYTCKHELGRSWNPRRHLGDQSRVVLDSTESRPRKKKNQRAYLESTGGEAGSVNTQGSKVSDTF